jgi:ribosomal protein S18 acetylase RimI-like enzyme
MSEPRIRPATGADLTAVRQIVDGAYRGYIPRIGKPPGPMLDDYRARIAQGSVSVVENGDGGVAGIIVLLPGADHLLLHNIAVDPVHQGRGFGRVLIEFAERQAQDQGYREIRLYTHEKMTENIALYGRIGFVETGRAHQEGFDRVFMAKRIGQAAT